MTTLGIIGRLSRRSAVDDLANDNRRARQIFRPDAEPHTMPKFIWNFARDSVFAQRAPQIIRHGLIFSGPSFRRGFVRIPVVGQSVIRDGTMIIGLRIIAGSHWKVLLTLNPL